jgi:hypothetical protein
MRRGAGPQDALGDIQVTRDLEWLAPSAVAKNE